MISTALRRALRIRNVRNPASQDFATLRNALRPRGARIRDPLARLLLNRFPR